MIVDVYEPSLSSSGLCGSFIKEWLEIVMLFLAISLFNYEVQTKKAATVKSSFSDQSIKDYVLVELPSKEFLSS